MQNGDDDRHVSEQPVRWVDPAGTSERMGR